MFHSSGGYGKLKVKVPNDSEWRKGFTLLTVSSYRVQGQEGINVFLLAFYKVLRTRLRRGRHSLIVSPPHPYDLI